MNPMARNLFLAALAVILVVGAGLIVFSQRGNPSTTTNTSGAETREVRFTVNGEAQKVTLVKVPTDAFSGSRFVLGADNAPLTMVEFADYQCPGCGYFAQNIQAQFKSEFVDTGKVRYAYRDFPLPNHQNAPRAAVAVACADEQGRWENMHNILYRAQAVWSNLSDEAFKAQLTDYARQVGLDTEAFSTCLETDRFDAVIQRDLEAGRGVNLSGTPTFVVNGYRVESDRVPGIEALRAIMASFGVN
jgi:protein-disulfide isomerase